MALNAVHNERLECPKLLLENLVQTVEFILDISACKQSVFFLHSGLTHLHARIKAILKQGAKVKHHLIFAQPSFAAFDTWLENSLTDHSLIRTLVHQRPQLRTLYYDWAFLQNDILFEALINCLHVLATRDLDIVTDIPSHMVTIAPALKYQAFMMPLSGVPVTAEIPVPLISVNSDASSQPSNSETLTSQTAENRTETSAAQSNPIHYGTDTEEGAVSVPEFSYDYGSPLIAPPDFSHLTNSDFDPNLSTSISSSLVVPVVRAGKPSSILASKSKLDEGYVKLSRKNLAGPTKSFLESGGYVQPPALGNFPLPQKGQSLTSFLSSLSDTMPELDRENAHFNVSEALISAFERLKVQQQADKMKEKARFKKIEDMFGTTKDGKKRNIPDGGPGASKRFYSGRSFPRPPILHTETEESEFEYWKQQPRRPPAYLKKKPRFRSLGSDGRSESVLSTTEVTSSPSCVSSDEDIASSSFSAENVALNLLRNAKMKEVQLPPASELRWLVSEIEAPQNLLPLPKNWNTSASESESDYSGHGKGGSVGTIDKTMRLRGTTDWAPPRPQIIFTIHPPPNLQSLMEIQKYRCAGCGMKVVAKYVSTFRYCHYLGRYFCTGCHTLKKARLPQIILHKWDFSPYMVSNFSATLLDSLQSDPVYNVLAINPNLNRKVKLNNFRNYRIQLGFLNDYLKNCKAATALHEEMNTFPTHYTADVDLYSLEDLIHLRFSTGLPVRTKDFVARAIHHVLDCQLCKQLGFLCEVCKRTEILFPFQINRVSRCPKCSSCFHLKCFNPGTTNCPKCLRLNQRRSTLTVSTATIAI